MSTRRKFLIASLALFLGACSASGASSPATAPGGGGGDKVTLGLTYIPNIQFSPFYVGVQQGIFSGNGVSLSLRHHGANEGLFTALASGQEDFVIAGGDEMVQARAQGMDVVAIAPYYRSYPVQLIVPADSAIAKPVDLKGRSVGVPGKYGESWIGLRLMLRDAGLSESDVTIQEIGYTSQAALTAKKVDAVMGFANNDVVQFGIAGVPVRAIPLTNNEIPLASISLVTTRKYLEANPERARKVVDSLVASVEKTASDQEGALRDSTEFVPNLAEAKASNAARGTLAATIRIMTGPDGKATGRLDPAQWREMTVFMKAQGLIDKDVDPQQAMSTAYATR